MFQSTNYWRAYVLALILLAPFSSKSQSYQDRIASQGEVYFLPLEKVRILTPFERKPDWTHLAVKDLELGMEFQLPTDGEGPFLTDVAYVADLDDYLLEKFYNRIFELFAKKTDLNPDITYYYVDIVISSAFTENNGLILYQDLNGAISTQLTIGASLREYRPNLDSKEIGGAYVYVFVKESTAEDIERGISSPVLKAVDRAKNSSRKKLD